jgi:hypothetical protein
MTHTDSEVNQCQTGNGYFQADHILFSIFTDISAGPGIGPTMNCTRQARHIIYQYSSGIEGDI